GKGLPAAFLMSSARTIFRVIAATEQSPSNVLKKVNDYLIEDLPFSRFITLIYLIIDPQTGHIVMSNAGHMWPMQKTLNSVNQIKHDPSFPLGIQKDDYVDYNILLEKGEKLILYSDGVSEAANSKEQFFDESHILASLNKPDGGMELIYKDLKIFTGSAPQNDDITMVEIDRIS
ncbi:MAG TPA: PP2C family protein-serine/threonine phosphatase, partial [Ignavibacteriaceae bacterium]